MKKSCVLALAVVLCLVVASAPFCWADDAYAKITGISQGVIAGDQPAINGLVDSKDAIQVFSTGFGLSLPANAAPVAAPFTIVKRFDRATPKLLRAAFTSELLTIDIVWYMTLQLAPRKTVTIRLENAVVSNIDASAQLNGNDAAGVEAMSVTYSRITFTTPIIDVNGKVIGQSAVCIDVASGKIC